MMLMIVLLGIDKVSEIAEHGGLFSGTKIESYRVGIGSIYWNWKHAYAKLMQ